MDKRRPADALAPGTTREPTPPPTDGGDATDVTTPENAGVEHEGATEEQVGDRTGPGAGYDNDFKRRRR